MHTDSAIVIPREGRDPLLWSPERGMAMVAVTRPPAPKPRRPIDEWGMSIQVEVYMGLNAIKTLTSYAHQMPELQPDKAHCIKEIEKCRERLFTAAIKVPHDLQRAKSGDEQLKILHDIKEFSSQCVYDASNAFEHLNAKCEQTYEVLRVMHAMKQELESWRSKALEASPLTDYPERDEYTPKFFADRTGIDVATVRHHLRELQKRHGRKKHSKDEGRWRIFDIEEAKKFEAYLRENGRSKPSQKAQKALR